MVGQKTEESAVVCLANSFSFTMSQPHLKMEKIKHRIGTGGGGGGVG